MSEIVNEPEGPATGLEYLNRLPWERMVTWAVVLFVLYWLRDFFFVIFATFVTCYFVRRLTVALLRRIPQQRHTVTLERAATLGVILMLLGLFLGLLLAICPELFKQAQAVLCRAEQTNL